MFNDLAKNDLQKLCLRRGFEDPEYCTTAQDSGFTSTVSFGGNHYTSRYIHRNKKEAEKDAATRALADDFKFCMTIISDCSPSIMHLPVKRGAVVYPEFKKYDPLDSSRANIACMILLNIHKYDKFYLYTHDIGFYQYIKEKIGDKLVIFP